MNSFRICFLSLLLVGFCLAYEDKDLSCGATEHITGLQRIVNNRKHSLTHRCSKFSPPVKHDVDCTPGKALLCNGQDEMCPDPYSWIGGLQAFDSGSNAEIYVPYCCKSPQVQLKLDKCLETKMNKGDGRPMRYFMPLSRVLYKINCQYVPSAKHNGFNDMLFASHECPYDVRKNV